MVKSLFVIIGIFGLLPIAYADIWVSVNGTGNGSRTTPMKSIQAAYGLAKKGDRIHVAPGVYNETLEFSDKPVFLIADSGPDKTVIKGKPGKSVLKIGPNCNGTYIRGFTISGGTGDPHPSSNGYDYYGGGVYAASSVDIEDCIIRGNGKGEPKKTSCTFGGGIWATGESTVRLYNCLVVDNFAWACGGGVGVGNAEIDIYKSTVTKNQSLNFFGCQGGVGLAEKGIATVSRSIIWGNSGDQVGAFSGPFSKGTRAYIESSIVENEARAAGIRQFQHDGCSGQDPVFKDDNLETGLFVPTGIEDFGFDVKSTVIAKCSRCRKVARKNDNFCSNCGTRLVKKYRGK